MWRMVKLGCYLDESGQAHIFPDRLMAHVQELYPEAGFGSSRADFDLIVDTMKESMHVCFPHAQIVIERESLNG
jgi:hypothetical protein